MSEAIERGTIQHLWKRAIPEILAWLWERINDTEADDSDRVELDIENVKEIADTLEDCRKQLKALAETAQEGK